MSGMETLDRLAELAREAGASDMAAEAQALARRAREGRFYVACVGEFKRGKSTLINSSSAPRSCRPASRP
jgi:ribosome biogenesis GTPase A